MLTCPCLNCEVAGYSKEYFDIGFAYIKAHQVKEDKPLCVL